MAQRVEMVSESVEQTVAAGRRLGERLAGGEVIALIGELGTGKTHFIKGLALGLGAAQAEAVVSPTFTLINEYEGRLRLYHVDAYRLERAEQLEALGFEEMCGAGAVMVVEWADRVWELVGGYAPITIRLEHGGPTRRRIVIEEKKGSV